MVLRAGGAALGVVSDGELREPLVRRQGSQVSMRVVSGNFCGRIKGVKYRFALKDGIWDFPGLCKGPEARITSCLGRTERWPGKLASPEGGGGGWGVVGNEEG